MSRDNLTRRSLIGGIGVALATATVPAAASARADENGAWTTAETPTGNTLYDVEYASGSAYAIGGGGVVLSRSREGWETVLDGGPTGNGNGLYGSDVTDDGKRLWFVGSSGAIGEYDVESGVLTDRSAPMDVTNNFNDVAVTGAAGEANVYVAGDSGKVYYSFENGAAGTWDYVTPGSGSAVNAIDFHGDRAGHLVDGNKTVFETYDGTTWEDLGIENANYNLYGVDSEAPDDVHVSGDGGSVYHWNGSQWVRRDTGDAGLRDVEVAGGGGLTVGSGGKLYALEDEGWTAQETPTGSNLKAVVSGRSDIAVGAGGTVIER
jgi:hypothetical protein